MVTDWRKKRWGRVAVVGIGAAVTVWPAEAAVAQEAGVTQLVAEVMHQEPSAATVSALVFEVLHRPSELRVTQLVREVAYDEDAEPPLPASPCVGAGEVPTGTDPAAGEDLSTATAPVVWVAVTVGATTYRISGATVPHSPPRDGSVVSFGTVSRHLSEPDSGPRAATVTVTIADTQREWRALSLTGTLKHALLEVYVSNLTTVVAEGTPFRAFRGRVSQWSADKGLLFTLIAEDELTARLTSVDAQDMAVGRAVMDQVSDSNPEEKFFGKPAPEAYGSVSDIDQDEPVGVWELRYTGSITFPEAEGLGNNHVFPICYGPVSNVQEVYGPSPFEDPPVSRVKMPASAFGSWLWVVTMPGWFGANDYYVDGSLGYRWALLVGQQNHPVVEMAREGRIPFVVNFCGYEETGDATGRTISSIPRGFLHWINARLLQDVVGDSDWPATIFALGDYSLINTASFELIHQRLEALSYQLGGILGHDYQFQSWRDRWALWLRHIGYGAATGYNRHGQIILVMLDRSDPYAGMPDVGPELILERGCNVRRRDDAVENVIRYVSRQNYKTKIQGLNPPEGERARREPYDGPWLYLPEPLEDSTSIGNLGGDPRGRRQSAIQEYGLTRDEATADALAEERLAWTKPANGRAQIDFDLSLRDFCALDLELGGVINVEHWDLPWTGTRRCQIRGIDWNLDTHEVTITVWDVGDLLP